MKEQLQEAHHGVEDLCFLSPQRRGGAGLAAAGGRVGAGERGAPETHAGGAPRTDAVRFENLHPRILGLSTRESESPKLSWILGCSLG